MKKGDILIRTHDGSRWIVVDPSNGKILPAPGRKETLSGPHYITDEDNRGTFYGLSGEMYRLEEKPEVGMDCTYCVGSDRYAGKIIEVSKSGKSFKYVLDDFYNKVDTARLSRKAGMEGTYRTAKRYRVLVGVKDPYRDPSF